AAGDSRSSVRPGQSAGYIHWQTSRRLCADAGIRSGRKQSSAHHATEGLVAHFGVHLWHRPAKVALGGTQEVKKRRGRMIIEGQVGTRLSAIVPDGMHGGIVQRPGFARHHDITETRAYHPRPWIAGDGNVNANCALEVVADVLVFSYDAASRQPRHQAA